MKSALGPIVETLLFTILVPGSVTVVVPYFLLEGFPRPANSPLAWLGAAAIVLGASIYFRCAWEFAVRGLGTPAPIAPTKFLVVTAGHSHIRNPMYAGVLLVLLGEAALFSASALLGLAACFIVGAHLFVVLYEEPALRRQFGESYEEYFRSVPRWIPRLGRRTSPPAV